MDLNESELISRISQANSLRVEGDIEEISTFSIYKIYIRIIKFQLWWKYFVESPLLNLTVKIPSYYM
ncbi:unnamed protein product [Blepharisma stoltei]|uniref:Uncharacterized protein n=1 Tax=Blepharisma stoltei TaxID=1481888 RepID=A0AAU9K8E3_9CILI|nr:unnamed protein product [Blepharisma stoltei]